MESKLDEINREIAVTNAGLKEIAELRLFLKLANEQNREVYYPFSGVYFLMTADARQNFETLKILHQKDLETQLIQKKAVLVEVLEQGPTS